MSDPQLGLFRDQSGQGTTEMQCGFAIIWNRLVETNSLHRALALVRGQFRPTKYVEQSTPAARKKSTSHWIDVNSGPFVGGKDIEGRVEA